MAINRNTNVKWKKIIIVVLIGIAAWFFLMGRRSTLLLAGLESFSSLSEVKAKIRMAEKNYNIRSEAIDSTSKFNRYHYLSIIIRDYTDLGCAGDLGLEFFNDRLMGVTFYPVEKKIYLDSLYEYKMIDLKNNQEVKLNHRTRIWKYYDYRNRFYVGSDDEKIRKQYNRIFD